MSEPEQGAQPQRIVITNEDLVTNPAPPPLAPSAQVQPSASPPSTPPGSWVNTPAAPMPPTTPPEAFGGGQLPGLVVSSPAQPVSQPAPYAPATGMTWGTFLTTLGSNAIISGLVAGAVGGFVGWAIAELVYSPNNWNPTSFTALDWDTGFYVMIYAAFLGFVLMGWDGFTSRSPQKMLREGGIGAAIGVGAGLAGGFLSNYVFDQVFHAYTSGSGVQDLEYGVAWAIFGALVGLGLGVRRGPKSTINGLLGGIAGGFVAGVIFHALTQNNTGSDGGPRMLGFTLTGIGIGAGIGLVTRVRRDAWLLFSGGPMRGKEFILQAAQTRLGSDYRCDIVLVKDAAVAPVHAVFARNPNGSVWLTAQTGAPIAVNGVATASGQLRSGDTVVIGSSVLTYEQRAASTL